MIYVPTIAVFALSAMTLIFGRREQYPHGATRWVKDREAKFIAGGFAFIGAFLLGIALYPV